MQVIVVGVCLAVAGCDVVWRLDDVSGMRPVDADRPGDIAQDGNDPCPFGPRIQLSQGAGNYDPQLSEDGLELFFIRGGSGTYDIWRAIRSDTMSMFPLGAAITQINSTAEDSDPAISADGNTIIFKSTRSTTGNRVYQSTRPNRGGIFSTPVLLSGLPGTITGLDLSADALTAYIDDGGKLNEVSRPLASSVMFNATRSLTIDRTGYPSVSGDGLELYYNGAGVVRRTRSTTSDEFDGATTEQIDEGGSDPDLTFDGKRLVFSGAGIIYMTERCRP